MAAAHRLLYRDGYKCKLLQRLIMFSEASSDIILLCFSCLRERNKV